MKKDKKSKVSITYNFNAPIGQYFDHADNVYFRMDSDGTFHFGEVESMPAQPADAPPTEAPPVSSPLDGGLLAAYAKAMASVQGFMWGQSSYAVLFCELRDHHHFPNNMSLFEQIGRLPIDWGQMEVKLKYGSIREFAFYKFTKERYEDWPTLTPRSEERTVFEKSLAVAQELDKEITKAKGGE